MYSLLLMHVVLLFRRRLKDSNLCQGMKSGKEHMEVGSVK
jgi:hypothetical protein